VPYLPDVTPSRTPSALKIDGRPLLRGWLHLVCFFLAVPAGIWVIFGATSSKARVGAAIYAVGLIALFGVSGSYHRGRWGPVWKRRMQRLDHTTIFVMIAGSYTPMCLIVLRGWIAVTMLVVAWTGAAVGAILAWSPGPRSGAVRSGLYVGLGWVLLVAAPQLLTRLEPTELLLIAIGGLLYTVGAASLATRWPDPFPRVFGYHEVWHVLVVAAVVCHLIAISSVLRSTGAA
jgi:hemolysin III